MEWLVFLAIAGWALSRFFKRSPSKAAPEREFVVTVGWEDDDRSYFRSGTKPRSGVTSEKCWVPGGISTKVKGFEISGGMIYVGTGLPAVEKGWSVEPALIDPKLSVDRKDLDPDGSSLNYWPSYDTIAPGARASYLGWLAGGRKDPAAGMGYVFLFLYGLERRVLADAERVDAARSELAGIREEVSRLLSIYGQNRSFRGYGGSFLGLLDAKLGRSWEPELETGDVWAELPANFRIAVGRLAMEKAPLPADWALFWVNTDGEIRLRTATTRCSAEFADLFRLRYAERYGDGLKLPTCKRRAKLDYRPSSGGFYESVDFGADVPNVTALIGPKRKLQQLVDDCCDALDAYSRKLGRDGKARGTLAATALLPTELVENHGAEDYRAFVDGLRAEIAGRAHAIVRADSVLVSSSVTEAGRLTKKQAVESARLLERAGFGVEPDVRFGGRPPKLTEQIVVFKLPEGAGESPTPEYAASALLLDLGAIVSAADGSVSRQEIERLREQVASRSALDSGERARLEARLEWLLVEPPSAAGVKKRAEGLTASQRDSISAFMVRVAWADGRVDPVEVRMLERMYGALGIDPERVHSDLHSLGAEPLPSEGPVSVRAADPAPTFGLPARPPPAEDEKSARGSVALDPALIHEKLAETAAVSALLRDIFDDEEPQTSKAPPPIPPAESAIGLDPAHAVFAAKLSARESWDRSALEALAGELGLFCDAAVETVNDRAFDVCGAPILEGNDPVDFNRAVYEEVLSA